MVQTGPTPTPFDVGRAFVHQYYTLLHQAPHLLHRFYSTDSTYIHGGVDRQDSIEQPAVGPDNIARRIDDLNLRDCHAKIRQVDSHPTIGNGVVVQVTGELSNNGDPMRRFMQTFVLAPRQPKKYYVQNDIFRYQDEVFDEASDEDDGSSSQIDADTDKVSNPDLSSAANTQQPSVVTAPSRPSTEEQQQPQQKHQPLPPRNAVHQKQVMHNETVRQQEPPLNTFTKPSGFNGQQETVQGHQQQQQQTKQATTSTEGASYAGVAKIQPSTGSTSNVNSTGSVSVPPTQQINTARPSSAVKSVPNQQRGNNNYYQQNNRGHQWNDTNTQQDQNFTRRSGTAMSTAPNEQQVFVGSLPTEFTQDTLIECFSQYGRVLDAKIHRSTHDSKKSFGFVIFEDPNVAMSVVALEHVMHNNIRLNVEPKTQKGYGGNPNNGLQGNSRNNSYPIRSGGGMNRGGNRGAYRGNGNNPRRGGGGGGQYYNNAPSFTGGEENYKDQQ